MRKHFTSSNDSSIDLLLGTERYDRSFTTRKGQFSVSADKKWWMVDSLCTRRVATSGVIYSKFYVLTKLLRTAFIPNKSILIRFTM